MKRTLRPVLIPIILLPLVAALVFELSPVSVSAARGIQHSIQAIKDGQPRIAALAAENVANQLPWRGDLWAAAGRYALAADDAERALRDFGEAQRRGNLDVQSLVEMGDAYRSIGKPEDAIRTWEQAIDLGFNNADVYKRLAEVYEAEGKLDAARIAWQRSLDLDSSDTHARYRLGLVTSVTDPKSALKILLQVSRDDPELVENVRTLQMSINRGLLEKSPVYAMVMTGRGLGQIGEWQLAAAAFKATTQLSPDYADAWAYYGAALDRMGMDGLKALEKAIALDPQSISAQAMLAVYWQQHKDYDQALKYLHALETQQPKNPTWQMEIGRTVAEQGKISNALPYFEQAVELDPNSLTPRQALITFCLQYDFMVSETALPATRELVSLDAKNPVSLDLAGQVFFVLGDSSTARRFFERALEEEPEFYLAHLHLGTLLLALGDRDAAYNHLGRATDPSADEAVRQAALRLIQQHFSQ